MVNGLGVVGWGVGGIEAEAAMLGQPVSMLMPQVLGFSSHGGLPEGCTATDLVLTVTEILREQGVVGKFVEFFGRGVCGLRLADRATIANMAPEFGSTIGFFPVDAETLNYLELTGRPQDQVDLVEAYAKEQGLWHGPRRRSLVPRVSSSWTWGMVVPSLAGPKRPQDRLSGDRREGIFQDTTADFVDGDEQDEQGYDEAVAESFPASDSPSHAEGNGAPHKPSAAPKDGGRPNSRVSTRSTATRRRSATAR